MEITINGFKTNYQVFGSGKPFLLLHGWGSNSERWEKFAGILVEKGFQVIVPDLPGFGKSDQLSHIWTTNDYTNWVEEFIEKLNLTEFYVMGHSFGGALACKFSIKYPQKVKKLFLVSSAAVRKHTNKKEILLLAQNHQAKHRLKIKNIRILYKNMTHHICIMILE